MIFKYFVMIIVSTNLFYSCSKTTRESDFVRVKRCEEGVISGDKICFNGDWKLFECSDVSECKSGPNPVCENYSCLYSCNINLKPDSCLSYGKVCIDSLCVEPFSDYSPGGIIKNLNGQNLTGYIYDDDYIGENKIFKIKVFKKKLYSSDPLIQFYTGQTLGDGSFSIPLGATANPTDSYRFFVDALDKNQITDLNPLIPSNWKQVKEDVNGAWWCSIISKDCFWDNQISIFDIFADGILWNNNQSSHNQQFDLKLLSNNTSGFIHNFPFATGKVNSISFFFDPIYTSNITVKLFLGETEVHSQIFSQVNSMTLNLNVNNLLANGISFSYTPVNLNSVVIKNIVVNYTK